MEYTIKLETIGNFTEEELKDFISYSLGCGSLPQSNPFISEDGTAEILDITIN